MKLRECIETIEREEECSRQDAIFDFLCILGVKIVHGCCIYYNDFIDTKRYKIDTENLTKLQALKLKNKFERRLIKLAEAIENKWKYI